MKVARSLMAGWWMGALLMLPGWSLAQTTQAAGQAGAETTAGTDKGGENARPKLIYGPIPEYTDKARKKKLSGACVLSLTVDASGMPQDVAVVQSIEDTVPKKLKSAAQGLDENAMKAVRQYRFRPAMSDGKPVPAAIKVEVQFALY